MNATPNSCGSPESHPQVGQRLELTKPYTSPTGMFLPRGTELRVALVGEGSTMLRTCPGGAVVWMDTHSRALAGW